MHHLCFDAVPWGVGSQDQAVHFFPPSPSMAVVHVLSLPEWLSFLLASLFLQMYWPGLGWLNAEELFAGPWEVTAGMQRGCRKEAAELGCEPLEANSKNVRMAVLIQATCPYSILSG